MYGRAIHEINSGVAVAAFNMLHSSLMAINNLTLYAMTISTQLSVRGSAQDVNN